MKIVSGIQPTEKIHIGNYLGAIRQWITLQDENECMFFIADLHAITTAYDPATFKNRVTQVLIAYLAAGLNPEKAVVFIQSQVPAHAELAWLLNTLTPLGEL